MIHRSEKVGLGYELLAGVILAAAAAVAFVLLYLLLAALSAVGPIR